jgi:hypothetical protein
MATNREERLEELLRQYVSCIENVGAQEWWEANGAVDLCYLYTEVCEELGVEPEPYGDHLVEDDLF